MAQTLTNKYRTYRKGISIKDGASNVENFTLEDLKSIKKMIDLINKNIECGKLLDWDTKVADSELARVMFKDYNYMVKDGWLYVENKS